MHVCLKHVSAFTMYKYALSRTAQICAINVKMHLWACCVQTIQRVKLNLAYVNMHTQSSCHHRVAYFISVTFLGQNISTCRIQYKFPAMQTTPCCISQRGAGYSLVTEIVLQDGGLIFKWCYHFITFSVVMTLEFLTLLQYLKNYWYVTPFSIP